MRFEWDPAREELNEEKHDISFEEATLVFEDPFVLVEDSTRPEHNEERFRAIGQMGPVMVTVIFTVREERRRIISVRRSHQNERHQYHHR